MPSSGFCDWLMIMVFLVVVVGLFLLGVWVVSRVWHSAVPTKKEVKFMRKCGSCGRWYDQCDVESMLDAMGFGPAGDPVDEDYLVLTDELCPLCWPEYS